MPIHFRIDHDKHYVEARAEGETGLEDVEKFLDAVVLQGALPYRKLFDGRLAVAVYNDNDIMMLGAHMSAYAANLEPRGAVAFIAGSEAASDLATVPQPLEVEAAGQGIPGRGAGAQVAGRAAGDLALLSRPPLAPRAAAAAGRPPWSCRRPPAGRRR
jgi:hypothetical protein